jgi:hypothetical protein
MREEWREIRLWKEEQILDSIKFLKEAQSKLLQKLSTQIELPDRK